MIEMPRSSFHISWRFFLAGVLLCLIQVNLLEALKGSAVVLQAKNKAEQAKDELQVEGLGTGENITLPDGTVIPVNVTAVKSKLTGNPQIDYVYDPNLPRELNGYNLTDYPFYNGVPEDIDFKCDGLHDGFYASVPHKCQVYHHCLFGTRYDFLCANYTAFDQKTFICHFVSEVDCDNSPKYFKRNEALYKQDTTTTPRPPPTTTTTTTTTEAPKTKKPRRQRPNRRPRPYKRRRPVYEYYYEDEEEPADSEYYEEEPATSSRGHGNGGHKRPKDRNNDDDYETEHDKDPAGTEVVKPSVRTSDSPSVYERPRIPPKIPRPVPKNERAKYDYKKQSETSTAAPSSGKETKKKEPEYYDDEYYDDVKPKPKHHDRDRHRPRHRPKKRPEPVYDEYEEEPAPKPKKKEPVEEARGRGGSKPRNEPTERPQSQRNNQRRPIKEEPTRKPEQKPAYEDEEEYEYYDDEEYEYEPPAKKDKPEQKNRSETGKKDEPRFRPAEKPVERTEKPIDRTRNSGGKQGRGQDEYSETRDQGRRDQDRREPDRREQERRDQDRREQDRRDQQDRREQDRRDQQDRREQDRREQERREQDRREPEQKPDYDSRQQEEEERYDRRGQKQEPRFKPTREPDYQEPDYGSPKNEPKSGNERTGSPSQGSQGERGNRFRESNYDEVKVVPEAVSASKFKPSRPKSERQDEPMKSTTSAQADEYVDYEVEPEVREKPRPVENARPSPPSYAKSVPTSTRKSSFQEKTAPSETSSTTTNYRQYESDSDPPQASPFYKPQYISSNVRSYYQPSPKTDIDNREPLQPKEKPQKPAGGREATLPPTNSELLHRKPTAQPIDPLGIRKQNKFLPPQEPADYQAPFLESSLEYKARGTPVLIRPSAPEGFSLRNKPAGMTADQDRPQNQDQTSLGGLKNLGQPQPFSHSSSRDSGYSQPEKSNARQPYRPKYTTGAGVPSSSGASGPSGPSGASGPDQSSLNSKKSQQPTGAPQEDSTRTLMLTGPGSTYLENTGPEPKIKYPKLPLTTGLGLSYQRPESIRNSKPSYSPTGPGQRSKLSSYQGSIISPSIIKQLDVTAPGPSGLGRQPAQTSTIRNNGIQESDQLDYEEYDVTLNDALQPSTLHPTRSLALSGSFAQDPLLSPSIKGRRTISPPRKTINQEAYVISDATQQFLNVQRNLGYRGSIVPQAEAKQRQNFQEQAHMESERLVSRRKPKQPDNSRVVLQAEETHSRPTASDGETAPGVWVIQQAPRRVVNKQTAPVIQYDEFY
ncbi:unnamed protein product [Bemisia tabaci]|uniref:Chitin-binding type-2 domain-containing protein n=1 Tax=Bemisia tabaci TaxID=7038 RepID=A0A9P0G1F9_BEMTA|nr:unnamed protein product [Bemisia tabaci]